ncbi:hypothetical protein OG562_22995 [Streptomyces sp. NBC_01275]|uniref:wHTH domain-containing protein n=1 Tax=Streptomyces sp. NBC_01275 TaxID=2903807 RepID=UPI00224CE629|nr:hypothetical protein [Streptomyces sp. NBC_01275]MCX4763780.1 hypothetical protein [Streptomyces sp. NBC_01275]
MAEPLDYWKALSRLVESAGRPKGAAVRAAMARGLPRQAPVPAESTVADWTALRRVPRDDAELKLFLTALQHLALTRDTRPAPRFRTEGEWRDMAEAARSEQRGKTRGNASSSPPQASRPSLGWGADVAESPVWQLLTPGDPARSGELREQARRLADHLAESYEAIRPALLGDPWHDEKLARRTLRWTSRIVQSLWRDKDGFREGFLSPAEGALIALLPFLYQVHRSRTAAELSPVDPTDLGQRTAPDRDRRAYEVVLRAHERLVRRAELGDLKDRPDGRPEIGWWLFHQWAKRQPGRLAELLADLVDPGSGLDMVAALLEPELMSRLLFCASAGPSEFFDPARAEHLREDPFELDFHGRDFQGVRERLVGPLFAVAHSMAIEVTDLSSVVVRHVGIPEALDPGRLLTTLEKATWQSRRDGTGLKAGCDHPAVVAALTEHTKQLESLLRVVRHTGAPELGALPLYTRADEVREVDDKGVPVPVDGLIRFRLDEERVQELLMGENLYRDRSLAIRELYQNALDACRYRRARSRASDPHSTPEGVIQFTQGFDAAENRHYLQCRDNGIGMDELTLSEVFSQAGVRFTDLPRYQEESHDWQKRGVTMHPNSRFGIGVLSYFMLADEVRVTTCHMDRVDGRLREITVLITGPGHYFRVRPTGEPGPIGTTVRLYLREGDKAPSCVRELRRFLGIAEFTTTAQHEGPALTWDPGILRPREPLGVRSKGFEAHGRNVSWSAGPSGEDGQVVWCEHGGGLLVDGIHAEPRVNRGILSRLEDSARLRGVVVNLTGSTRPRRLSVDRTEILDDDVCVDVERLVRNALPTLLAAEPALLTDAWLNQVASRSIRLADIVTEAAGAAGYELETQGVLSAVAVTGFFPSDIEMVHDDAFGELGIAVYGPADSVTQLWRILAHRPNGMLTALTELVPELDRVEGVLPALPSDNLVRTIGDIDGTNRTWPSPERLHKLTAPGHSLSLASACGLSYGEIVARMTELRLPTAAPPDGDPVVDDVNLALLSDRLNGSDPLGTDGIVPPGHLLKAHFEFGISIQEAALRMRTFGFHVSEPDWAAGDDDELTLRLVSEFLNGQCPWLDVEEPVSPVHLYKAYSRLDIGIGDAIGRLTALGFSIHGRDALKDDPNDSTVRLFTDGLETMWLPSLTTPVSAANVFRAAVELDRPVTEVVQEIRAHDLLVDIDPVHERLPLDVLRDSEAWGLSIEEWGDLCESRKIPPGLLAHTALLQGVSLEEAARRFRALGFETPSALPVDTDPTDLAILSIALRGNAPWCETDRPVSILHVARASLRTGIPPAAVTSRLRAYGLEPPDTPFEPHHEVDGEFRIDAYFRDPENNSSSFREPSEDRPVPLHYLVSVALQLSTEPRRIAKWLSSYGFPIHHAGLHRLDLLDEADHRLCRPWRWGTHLRLHLDTPLTDFCAIARASDLPAPDLIARLDRLDVDLDRVREAVRAALPEVPGLVMRPAPEGEPGPLAEAT